MLEEKVFIETINKSVSVYTIRKHEDGNGAYLNITSSDLCSYGHNRMISATIDEFPRVVVNGVDPVEKIEAMKMLDFVLGTGLFEKIETLQTQSNMWQQKYESLEKAVEEFSEVIALLKNEK